MRPGWFINHDNDHHRRVLDRSKADKGRDVFGFGITLCPRIDSEPFPFARRRVSVKLRLLGSASEGHALQHALQLSGRFGADHAMLLGAGSLDDGTAGRANLTHEVRRNAHATIRDGGECGSHL